MSDDRLTSLKNVKAPAPDEKGRAAALHAAMQAFDAEAEQKNETSPKGSGWRERLMVIFNPMRWTMDIRVPIAAGVAGLFLVPLAFQLSSQTALTPPDLFRPDPLPLEAPVSDEFAETELVTRDRAEDHVVADGDMRMAEQSVSAAEAAPMTEAPLAVQSMADSEVGAVSPTSSPAPSGAAEGGGILALPQTGDEFASFETNPIKITSDEPVSTFSVDVDTASYAYVRRALESGVLPNRDSVRVEEMINYFDYDYPTPDTVDAPFSTDLSLYPAPWDDDHLLLQIGIKGYEQPLSADAPKNLVFLIDSSGSMDASDKLPLLKQAFSLLIDQLDENDTISIVTYAGAAGVVLEPTPASEKAKVLSALQSLRPGGSTAGAAGIETAYNLAREAFSEDGINRVILATDGDFNVGISDPDGLERLIETRRDEGISLSVLGFGTGNLNDAVMQSLAQNGNGNASYIDSFREARKVLVEEMSANLFTIASDVKIQVEFNPATVSEYRLIGYETRALNREDFNNDTVDAGDIGAGHTVTAIYEITPVGAETLNDPLRYGEEGADDAVAPASADEYAYVKLRYKLPGEGESRLLEWPVDVASALASVDDAPVDTQFAAAVAALGQKLRGGEYLDGFSYADVKALAQGGRGEDEFGYRAEFISLVDIASSLTGSAQ